MIAAPRRTPARAPAKSAERPTGGSVLELRYRSAGSFLIAYSSRLSRGEIFVETESPWPQGTRAHLRLHVPGVAAPLELPGTVAWTRPAAIGPGQPTGMGIALGSSIESQGAVIDDLASKYAGTRILLGTTDPTFRAIAGRYLRSILTCELVEADFFGAAVADGPIDLALVDMDSASTTGPTLVQSLRDDPNTADVPIIVLAQTERDRARSATLRVDEVLSNPPPFADIHAAVIHALSRPLGGPDAAPNG